jgi:hypothetical protein
MLRTYRWRGVFWRFEDGKAPEGAVLCEVAEKPVTPETPKKAPAKRTTRTRKPKTQE